MAGASLNAYLDLVNRTGPAIFAGKEEIVNDAVKQTYGISPFMRGKGIAEMFRGGKYITDEWFPDESTTAVTHLPGASFTWSNPQTSKYWSANYRFLMDHMSVIDQEEDLNGPEQAAGMARFQQIKSMMWGKKQRLMTSVYNKMDNLLFAEPDFNAMEFSTSTSSTASEPYSLAAFVNEYGNGLFNSTGTGAAGTAWTTVEGINPTSTGNTKWKKARVTYSSSSTAAAPATGTAATGVVNVGDVIAGFDAPLAEGLGNHRLRGAVVEAGVLCQPGFDDLRVFRDAAVQALAEAKGDLVVDEEGSIALLGHLEELAGFEFEAILHVFKCNLIGFGVLAYHVGSPVGGWS